MSYRERKCHAQGGYETSPLFFVKVILFEPFVDVIPGFMGEGQGGETFFHIVRPSIKPVISKTLTPESSTDSPTKPLLHGFGYPGIVPQMLPYRVMDINRLMITADKNTGCSW